MSKWKQLRKDTTSSESWTYLSEQRAGIMTRLLRLFCPHHHSVDVIFLPGRPPPALNISDVSILWNCSDKRSLWIRGFQWWRLKFQITAQKVQTAAPKLLTAAAKENAQEPWRSRAQFLTLPWTSFVALGKNSYLLNLFHLGFKLPTSTSKICHED